MYNYELYTTTGKPARPAWSTQLARPASNPAQPASLASSQQSPARPASEVKALLGGPQKACRSQQTQQAASKLSKQPAQPNQPAQKTQKTTRTTDTCRKPSLQTCKDLPDGTFLKPQAKHLDTVTTTKEQSRTLSFCYAASDLHNLTLCLKG